MSEIHTEKVFENKSRMRNVPGLISSREYKAGDDNWSLFHNVIETFLQFMLNFDWHRHSCKQNSLHETGDWVLFKDKNEFRRIEQQQKKDRYRKS